MTDFILDHCKKIAWLALHGCDIKDVDFFPRIELRVVSSFYVYEDSGVWETIKQQLSSIRFQIYYDSFIREDYLDCVKKDDWIRAKKAANLAYKINRDFNREPYTNAELDDIPF